MASTMHALHALLVVALVAAAAAARVAWMPFRVCGRCSGTGQRRPRFSLRTVPCGRCGGLGQRYRPSVRAWHAVTGRGR